MTSDDASEALALAADLARSLRAVRRDLSQLARSTRAAVEARRSILGWLRELPRLSVPLSHDQHGEAVLEGLTFVQPWPMRFRAVAVISLPATFEEYLRGRSMQAARTNCANARARGMSVVPISSTADADTLLRRMLDRRDFHPLSRDDLARKVAAGRTRLWFVLGPDDEPIGMAAVAVDRGVAQLALLAIALDVEHRSAARYLLSVEIVRGLIAESREHLLADSMLLAEPGVVYLQRRLGFQPMHLVVPRGMRWRRLAKVLIHGHDRPGPDDGSGAQGGVRSFSRSRA